MQSEFDFFISYKSEEVQRARPIAEALISQGLSVWFAEYEVLLLDYDQHKRVLFDGLNSSSFAIFITSDLWASSDHCLEEYDILESRLSANRLIEIARVKAMLPHQKRPKLADSPRIEYTSDIPTTLQFIAQATGLTVEIDDVGLPSKESTKVQWVNQSQCTMFRFDVGPFESKPQFLQGQNFNDALFNGRIDGISVQMGVFSSAQRTAIGKLAASSDIAEDDRELSRQYRSYASQKFLADAVSGQRVDRGLHLFFFDGRGQIALTYTYLHKGDVRWERRYVITVERSAAKPAATVGYAEMAAKSAERIMGEIDIVFACDMRKSERNAMAQFCRLTPTFDAIVASMEYYPITLAQSPYNDNYQRTFLNHKALPFRLALPVEMRVDNVSPDAIKLMLKRRGASIAISMQPTEVDEVLLPNNWSRVSSRPMEGGGEIVFARSDLSSVNKLVRRLRLSFKTLAVFIFCFVLSVLAAWVILGQGSALIVACSYFGISWLIMVAYGSQSFQCEFLYERKQYTIQSDLSLESTVDQMIQPLLMQGDRKLMSNLNE